MRVLVGTALEQFLSVFDKYTLEDIGGNREELLKLMDARGKEGPDDLPHAKEEQ